MVPKIEKQLSGGAWGPAADAKITLDVYSAGNAPRKADRLKKGASTRDGNRGGGGGGGGRGSALDNTGREGRRLDSGKPLRRFGFGPSDGEGDGAPRWVDGVP